MGLEADVCFGINLPLQIRYSHYNKCILETKGRIEPHFSVEMAVLYYHSHNVQCFGDIDITKNAITSEAGNQSHKMAAPTSGEGSGRIQHCPDPKWLIINNPYTD